MANFERLTRRFGCKGINLRSPVDAQPDGKYPILSNVRAYLDNAIVPRPGLTRVTNPALGAALHSVRRLNDLVAGQFARMAAAAANLFVGTTGNYGSAVLSGFSGDPLALLPFTPADSPTSWMAVGDSAQMAKVAVDGTTYGLGIAAPTVAPTGDLGVPLYNVASDFEAISPWTPQGSVAGAISLISRINTVIGQIIYDQGSSGWATVLLNAADANVQPGCIVTVNGSEQAFIQEVKPAVASTTIAAILYDSGSTGLCTIQPTSSLAAGALDNPVPGSARSSTDVTGTSVDVDPVTGLPRSRLIDVETNSLLALGGSAEFVRVISATVGADGIQSFRCSTVHTHAAGDAIIGSPSIRIYLAGTYTGGTTVVTHALRNTLTPSAITPVPSMTGGITRTISLNWAQIGNRPAQPDDQIHLSIRIDNLQAVSEGRIYFDVDGTTNDFTKNYYFFAFRPSDIIAAIPSTATGTAQSITSSRLTAYQRAQLDRRTPAPGTVATGYTIPRGSAPTQQGDVGVDSPLSGSAGTPGAGLISQQIGAGSSQWAELRFKLSDLTRVGSDQNRTLANIAAIQIVVACTTVGTVQIDYDALWLAGSYGADVGTIGAPYIYSYRYRSSVTGAVSNPSPAMRSGLSPRRQDMIVQGTGSSDPQVDRNDWYRLGGALESWVYVGSTNDGAAFDDVYGDPAIAGNPGLEVDNFQPWPTTDIPRTGVCSVAGTAVSWGSGDTFNAAWAPGSIVEINGIPYTLYAPPSSTTFLQIVENAGALTSVPFLIQSPTLMGTPLPCLWGDYLGFLFGCGDPNGPNLVYWTKGNQPEVASDANFLVVTNPSDQLQNGFIYDARPFVLSTLDLYELVRTEGAISDFDKRRTTAGKGLWARWAFAVGPFIWYLTDDGILQSDGATAASITDTDLYPLFPHDGVPGVSVNGYVPPDMTATAALRLAYSDGFLYFTYTGTDAAAHTLVYDVNVQAWYADSYSVSPQMRFADESGAGIDGLLMGGRDGNLYLNGSATDNGTNISCHVRTPSETVGDPRVSKLFGDALVDVDAAGGAGVLVQLGYNRFTLTPDAAVLIDAAVSGRTPVTINVQAGAGYTATDVGLDLTYLSTSSASPTLFLWQPAYVTKVETTLKRATDWDDAGYTGTKYVRALLIRADTLGQARTVQIQTDGATVAATLSINDNGELLVPYAVTPFTARLLRLIPTDANSWRIYEARYLFDQYPELIAETTDWQDAGFAGEKYVREAVINADTNNAIVSIQIQGDEGAVGATFNIQHNGQVEKGYGFPPFLAHTLRLVPAAGARIFGVRYIFDQYPELTAHTTDWQDAGFTGTKYVRGVVINGDTNNQPVTVTVEGDDGAVITTFTATHNGQVEIPYAFTPFIAHNLRLVAAAGMRVFAIRWIFDQYPELVPIVTAWDDSGYQGAKFVQGVVLNADTANMPVNLQVQKDGEVLATTIVGATHNGQVEVPYSFATPFIAHNLRIVPLGNIRIFSARWVTEPTPELALTWQTQPTTHDLSGYLHVRDMFVAYLSTQPVTLAITIDNTTATYTLPSTSGVYAKTYVSLQAIKGRAATYRLTSTAGFQIYQRDTEVRVRAWGDPGPYVIAHPFGDVSRINGARI